MLPFPGIAGDWSLVVRADAIARSEAAPRRETDVPATPLLDWVFPQAERVATKVAANETAGMSLRWIKSPRRERCLERGEARNRC